MQPTPDIPGPVTKPRQPRKPNVPIGFPKHSEEWYAEVARRQKVRDVARRAAAKAAAAKGSRKQRIPVSTTKSANFLPPLKHLAIRIPEKLESTFGEVYKLSNNQDTWYFKHAKRTNVLATVTQKQYGTLVRKIKTIPGDMYDRLAWIVVQPLQHKAQYIKAWLAHIADKVAEWYESERPISVFKEYADLIAEMTLFADLSKRTKQDVKELQTSQVVSKDRLDNTVEWSEWVTAAKRYALTISKKKDATIDDMVRGVIAALYSYLPPIRLDYEDVTVVHKKPKKMTDNTLVLSGVKSSAFYWMKFKNAEAFAKQGSLPIRQPLPPFLIKLLKRYMKMRPDATKLFQVPHFSEKVTETALIITDKRFTNRLMRSSFITDFYNKAQAESMDLNKIKDMMRSIHQTNIETNISYIKKLAEGEDADM